MSSGASGTKKTKKPEQVSQSGKKKKMPSLMKQAKNFATSMTKHVASGAQSTPPHVKRSRLEICNTCDKLQGSRCSECGCFVEMKAGWASEACPLAKWGPYSRTEGGCNCGRK
tara:strand:+ start:509 stop:847 length:339 start_codon:yes stop_codon:yes gene_type:complete